MKPKRPVACSMMSAASSRGWKVFAKVRRPEGIATTASTRRPAAAIASASALSIFSGVGAWKSSMGGFTSWSSYTLGDAIYTRRRPMITATVSEKGWIVIPKSLRDKYGINKGQKVAILEGDGLLKIIPIPDDPIAAGRGMLKGGRPWAEMMADKRREIE